MPIGHTVNANVAMVTGFSCHEDRDEARRRGAEGFQFFGYSLGHYYVYGHHQPGVTDVWQRFEAAKDKLPAVGQGSGIGTPAELTEHLRSYQDAGVDQVVFIQQGGRNKHEHICDSLNLFAAKVMPALKTDQAARDAKKQAELAPFIAAALKRKKRMAPVAPGSVPTVSAYGRTIVQENQTAEGPTHHIAADITVMMDDPAEKKNKEAAERGHRGCSRRCRAARPARHRRTELLALLDEAGLPGALADQRLLHGAPAQAGRDRLDAAARAGAVAAGADVERVGQALRLLQAGIVAAVEEVL